MWFNIGEMHFILYALFPPHAETHMHSKTNTRPAIDMNSLNDCILSIAFYVECILVVVGGGGVCAMCISCRARHIPQKEHV